MTKTAAFRKIRGLNNSSVAQLVEQMTVNHWVTGSSPVGGAIYIKALASKDARAFLLVPTFGQFRNAYTELKIQNYLRDSVATETSTS